MCQSTVVGTWRLTARHAQQQHVQPATVDLGGARENARGTFRSIRAAIHPPVLHSTHHTAFSMPLPAHLDSMLGITQVCQSLFDLSPVPTCSGGAGDCSSTDQCVCHGDLLCTCIIVLYRVGLVLYVCPATIYSSCADTLLRCCWCKTTCCHP